MTRPMRLVRNVGIGLAAFVLLVLMTGVLVVRTEWFRDYVREKIITATEEGTGGRVEIGSFSFDWTHLTAVVTDFVIHGNEPAGSPPYVSAHRVELHVRLFTSIHHLLDITYLGVERPQANVFVAADGSTNVPKPKQTSPSNSEKTPLQTVVDLAVGRFELSNGSVNFNSHQQDLDLRGESLRVQLWYNALNQSYKGEIALAPLYVASGRNTPVKFLVTLPVSLDSKRIALQNARVETDKSRLVIDGSLENLNNPKSTARIRGRVALADLRSVGNLQLALDTRGLPSSIDLDVNATVAGNEIDVTNSRIAYGNSSIQASGKLEDAAATGALRFQAQLAMAELARLTKQQMPPLGTLEARGSAKMTPQRLDLSDLRIDALGAEITGSASLEDFARYSVNATLSHLNLQTLMHTLGQKGVGYGGIVSGPIHAEGDLKATGTNSLSANARLAIAPTAQGVPVSGRIFADYRGDTGNLAVNNSFLTLPHTRLNISGSIGSSLKVALNTTDLGDFAPLTGGNLPVVLNGPADFTGAITGRLDAPQIAGHLAVDRFTAEGRQFDGITGDVAASKSRVALSSASVRRGNMQTQIDASLGLRDWSPSQNQPVAVTASIRNGDLADVMALAGTSPTGYSGALTADATLTGTLGDPCGAVHLIVANGTLNGEPVDRLQAQLELSDQLVTLTNAEVISGQSHADLTAEFHHPRDRFERGAIHAHLQTNQVDLAKLRTVQNLQPNSGGALQATADITGQLTDSFVPTNVTADFSGRGLRFDGQTYGDVTGTARTNRQIVNYNLNSDFAGSQIHVNGNTSLAAEHRTTADGNVSGLPIDRMLVLLKRTDIPAKGALTATFHLTGTVAHPEGNLDATVDHGVFDGEPIDRVHARVNYLATSIDVPQLQIAAGQSNLDATAHYDHKAGVLDAGEVQFHINNGHVDLAHLHIVQQARPGLAGIVQISANGAATVNANSAETILPRDVNLYFSGKGLAMQGKNLGDLTLAANTTGGRVNFTLDSNLAGATIQGGGNAQLGGDYPMTARVSVHNVTWKGLQPLIGPVGVTSTDIDAATDGEITLDGPALKTDAMTGRLQLSRLLFTAKTQGVHPQTVTVQNQGPVALTLDHGVARIESLHLTGPQTDIQAQGSVSLAAQTIQASLNAHTDLGLLQSFDRDLLSSGQITVNATARGTFANPLINGKLQLQDASVHLIDVTAGLSNANGTVDFNGSSASFQNLTGEIGGGKVTLSGFMAYSGATRMALRVSARNVRVALQPGVSAAANADLHLTGRLDSSLASGTVTITQITYQPQSDLGAILTRSAPEIQTPAAPSLLLDNMKLDVQVATAAGMMVHASVAQTLQMDGNIRIQGTASQPGVTGRIGISDGKLVFLGSTYTVNSGTISFFNPIRVDPVLDLSLATQAHGVDVTLRVTGSIDNMKLSYTSNPPLQFEEVVGLLAAGQTPTSDPTLLANQPAQPAQNFQAMGESAVVSQALADPVANRLQRVFGLTQLKIDPTFANGQDLPQAAISLQQQVTSRITLTYSTPVGYASQTAVSGQFLLSPEWSAAATRDQFGLLSIKLMFKKQFK